MKKTYETLQAGLDYLNEHGWTQYELKDEKGSSAEAQQREPMNVIGR